MKRLIAILLLLPLWGCAGQGTLQRAGKNTDDALDNVRDGVGDVVDDVRDGAKDVEDDVKRSRGRSNR